MPIKIPFDNSYADLPTRFFTKLPPTPVAAPALVHFNTALAADLGLSIDATEAQLAGIFSGNTCPSGADPLAQVYSGHQFGTYNPRLGDGRAILLGEINSAMGRVDIQLKGAGPTPYSRAGDGRAWLGPVLREYIVSEAMHALGIPTTRALAAVTTGQKVQRETALPGAILTRVAQSHIRVGTFQYFAAQNDTDALQILTDYTIARHFPEATGPGDLLVSVIDRQAKLIAQWMSVGFIHGVMNTDNTQIAGETIDYGPCAFMDVYHPVTVFSSIDRQGRYAFDNQSKIIVWNMAQLATSLLPLMPDIPKAVTDFTEIVHAMPAQIQAHFYRLHGAKIGLTTAHETSRNLVDRFLGLMADNSTDFTNSFRALGNGTARELFADTAGFDAWHNDWQRCLTRETGDPIKTMAAANPAIIPRNHQIEKMIAMATDGDYSLFHRLRNAFETPFNEQPENADLTKPPQDHEKVQATFCGT